MVVAAAFTLAPTAIATPSNVDAATVDQPAVDSVGRLIRLADRAAQVGTDPIALSELTNFAWASVEAARSSGVIDDASDPLAETLRCVVDVLATGAAGGSAQTVSCLTPLTRMDPLLGLRVLSSLQVDLLDPALPHAPEQGPDETSTSDSAAGEPDSLDSRLTQPPPEIDAPAPRPDIEATPIPGPTRSATAAAPSSGIVTSSFGTRAGAQHGGVDIADSLGAPIVAAADGTVISAGPAQGFGLWVRIRHDDGSITTYGHNDGNSVTVGQRVVKGQQIAQVGNRGNSTGPHLHFESTSPGGQKVDPESWLRDRGAQIGAGRLAQ
ncbi:hypothetical protein A3K89_17500 [Rhodococcoides kyotonense]|uniref:M23ase beta-sheet core domain-containing protein n=2 Tax=Mycobacteriales TaxID=85007 RepID=A0A177YLX1_9NOCA|nr:hypothetical protein A3K89_17500 [Rhodococcus kyotonensis]